MHRLLLTLMFTLCVGIIMNTVGVPNIYAKPSTSSTAPLKATLTKQDINLVGIDALMQIKGIGKRKAQEILNYRKKFGPLKNLNQLKDVKGISEPLFQQLALHFTVK